MKHITTFFFLVFILSFPGFAAGESCKLVTFPIPLMVESSNKGVFIELTKKIGEKSNLDISIQVLPAKRAVNEFKNNKFDGIFPGLDILFDQEISPSTEISIKEDFAFTRKESPFITTIQDLAGKKIGITLGYPYAKQIIANKSLNLENSKNDVLNMKKLSAGRIDVFIVEEKSGLKALDFSGVSNIVYPAGKSLSKQKVYYAFQPDSTGKQFASKISKALLSMKKDGTFGAIMSKAE
ncbi:MAG: transporter substrate-binding domain-containing protein [Desulfobacula sp.]|nr:transporter substrate-binding domain-containing protein [Desulfobacula sp.]